MKKTIHLFRHGKPEESLHGRCRGADTDCGLSAEGEEQTAANVQYIVDQYRDTGLQNVYVITSGMKRTESFGRMLEEQGAILYEDPENRLRTIHAGEWEKLSWTEIQQQWPDQYEIALTHAEDLEIPGGEAVTDFRKRVIEVFHDCLELPADHLVIVGHGSTNEIILAEAEGRKNLRFRSHPEGSMSRIEMDESGDFAVTEKKRQIFRDLLNHSSVSVL